MSLNLLIVILLVGGWIAGKISVLLRLPSVLGMTLWGIALSYFFKPILPSVIWEMAPFLKSAALVVILLRAGLGIRRASLKKVGRPALLMSFIPCLFEGFALTGLGIWIFHLPWSEAGMLGFILAAVSPAVVVPSMLNLKEKGYGQKKDIPTLILAGASLDDVFAITLFTVFLDFGKSGGGNLLSALAGIPVSVILGILPGIVLGFGLVWFFKTHEQKVRATEKALLLVGFSLFLIEAGNWIHAATLLGIMSAGLILLEKHEKAAGELSQKLNKAWVGAEILLFTLIGMAVDVHSALTAGFSGLALISLGLAARSTGVWIALIRSGLNQKEKLFCVFAYLPKATVQAAMGSVPLAAGIASGPLILSVAVLSILLTAPLGLILIRFFGHRLLSLDLGNSMSPESDDH